jgi:DNA-binding NarL/FixJ family response regulator
MSDTITIDRTTLQCLLNCVQASTQQDKAAYRKARLLLLLPPPRQCQAVKLAGLGRTNAEIAMAMGITEYAVVSSMDRAFKFLNVHSRKEAYKRLMELEKAALTLL